VGNPNIPSQNHEEDFRQWEREMETPTDQNDRGEVPFGAHEMITLDPEAAVGMLACIYGLGSGNVDDDQSGDQVSKNDDPGIFPGENFNYETNIGELV